MKYYSKFTFLCLSPLQSQTHAPVNKQDINLLSNQHALRPKFGFSGESLARPGTNSTVAVITDKIPDVPHA
jgi:hypothetical protein